MDSRRGFRRWTVSLIVVLTVFVVTVDTSVLQDPTQPPTDPTQPPTVPTKTPTDPNQPPTGLTQPPTGPTQPQTGPTQPPTGPTQPPTGPTQPPTDPTQPPTGPTQPPTGPTQPPTGRTQPPTGPTQPPTGLTQPSTDPTQPPTDPTQPPTDPTQPPTDPTQPPTDPTQPPTDPTQPPTGLTQPSTGPTKPPTDPTQPPTDPTQPPTGPTQPPTDPTQPPTGPTQPPTDPTQPPTDPTQPPTGPTQPPTDPTQPLTSTPGCGGTLTTLHGGNVTSPNYPNDYGNDMTCEWLITVPEGNTIRLEFSSFNTEKYFDILHVYDGDSDTAPRLQIFTGWMLIDPIASSSNTMFVRFVSDDRVTEQGFQFSYTTNRCDQHQDCLNGEDEVGCPGRRVTGRLGVNCVTGFPNYLYRGTVSVTLTGRTCQQWDSQTPHEHEVTPANLPFSGLEQNYCRNPDKDKNVWCITTDPEQPWEYCDVPRCSRCPEGDARPYRGTVSVTSSGRMCQRWDSQTPHRHLFTPSDYPTSGLERNYCRNPDGDSRVWCFTTDPEILYEYCDVPACPGYNKHGEMEGYCKKQEETVKTLLFPGRSPNPQTPGHQSFITRRSNHSAKRFVHESSEFDIPGAALFSQGRHGNHCKKQRQAVKTPLVPGRGCQVGDGTSYRGSVYVTASGRTCQDWNSQTPHEHGFTPANYPSSGLKENYCRNPDGATAVWCYTTDPDQRWEYCDVPACVGCLVGDGTSYRGSMSVTLTGRTCQDWNSQTPHEHGFTPANYPSSGLDQNYCRNPDGAFAVWCYTTDPEQTWEYCDVPRCAVLAGNFTNGWTDARLIAMEDDFRVDCELCRHWGLSRRTGAKQNCAGGVEERRGRSRFFAGAKQNGAGAKQNGGGEEEGVSWGCCQIGDGKSYRGSVSMTLTGRTCQDWNSQTPHEHGFTPANHPSSGLEQNYCRNPDGKSGVWCYTTDPGHTWEYCVVPTCPGCQTGSFYRGKVSVTREGRTCQHWDSQTPNAHTWTPANYPYAGLDQNYCRNPDGRATPWCYTTDPEHGWELCDVPACSGCSEGELQCLDGSCIPKHHWCNGGYDCPQGEDEVATDCGANNCSESERRCFIGLCIPEDHWCNGVNDCVFGDDDEANYEPDTSGPDKVLDNDIYTFWSPVSPGPWYIIFDFLVPYTLSKIDIYNYGDITRDITAFKFQTSVSPHPYNWTDVVGFNESSVSLANFSQVSEIGGFTATSRYWRLFITATGPDNSPPRPRDVGFYGIMETDLEGFQCEENERQCSNGWCIPASSWCDSRYGDCPDSEDEEGCFIPWICTESERQCSDGVCIPEDNWCDGIFLTVETTRMRRTVRERLKVGMEAVVCPGNERQCLDSSCIPDYYWCDGYFLDCANGEDETDCGGENTTAWPADVTTVNGALPTTEDREDTDPFDSVSTEVQPDLSTPSGGLTTEEQPGLATPPGGVTTEEQPDLATPPSGLTTEGQPVLATSPDGFTTEEELDLATPPGGLTTEGQPDLATPPGGFTTEEQPGLATPPGGFTTEEQPGLATPPGGLTTEEQLDLTMTPGGTISTAALTTNDDSGATAATIGGGVLTSTILAH
ncbi:hypothetical protein Bbelb_199800, partial [Branchiostoma belcheri]